MFLKFLDTYRTNRNYLESRIKYDALKTNKWNKISVSDRDGGGESIQPRKGSVCHCAFYTAPIPSSDRQSVEQYFGNTVLLCSS